MIISIVLSSYNGRKYIIEQLDSILHQTRQPDEVLIFDDCSTDGTPTIVSRFICEHGLEESWKLIRNNVNLGWKRNFMGGFKLATGDVIFSADQDDVWMSNKIEKMMAIMEANDNITLLSCNLLPLYESSSQKLHPMYIRPYGRGRLEKVNMGKFFITPLRPGCTYAFRREILNKVQEIWYPEWAHDSVLYLTSLMTDGYFILNEPLIHFRRHGNNNSPKNIKTRESRIRDSKDFLRRLELFKERESLWCISKHNMARIEDAMDFYHARIDFFSSDWFRKNFSFLKYVGFYAGIKSFLGDYYIKFFNK